MAEQKRAVDSGPLPRSVNPHMGPDVTAHTFLLITPAAPPPGGWGADEGHFWIERNTGQTTANSTMKPGGCGWVGKGPRLSSFVLSGWGGGALFMLRSTE